MNNEFVEEISKFEYNNILYSINLEYTESFIVPNDKILVLGDNRINSTDSRVFGFIDEEAVIGKVLIRIYPIRNFGNPDKDVRR